MKSILKTLALDLGFDAFGVTSAAPPATAERFMRWLESGSHGEMGYLQRNAAKRIDPHHVLAEARSIITLAASYANQAPFSSEPPPGSGPRGIVARYARHADYHDVLRDPLRALAQRVDKLGGPGTHSLWYVDTGPLLERDLAQRAGLGFVGKHTNLVSRQLGNWFLLAEIITTLPLEPDAPETNRCGTCTRCLAACPTGAITAPFQLDARRCISYLTIELKGSIPEPLRPLVGNRIFGCDDCLAACPWNRFAKDGRLMREHARNDLAAPDLVDLLTLDDTEFKRRFAGTPILRSKRRGLLRNVCVALGNTGDSTALPALRRAAADSEPLIAEHAQWALRQVESTSCDGGFPGALVCSTVW
ncbi:MAG: tRNA epoxyqueuosine(34) reductase QueG [Verrucomicrobiia bacterium]